MAVSLKKQFEGSATFAERKATILRNQALGDHHEEVFQFQQFRRVHIGLDVF